MDEPTEVDDNEIVFTKKREKVEELSFNQRVELMGGENGKFSRKLQAHTNSDTYFRDALEKWIDQDQGSELVEFAGKVPPFDVKTYAQLLHKADFIFEVLLEHMSRKGAKSLPAFCELLSAFARDMREKFSGYMWKSFDILVNILDIGERDADSVEAAFLCLTVLVKLAAGGLVKQLKKSFTNFLPLFASSRPYVRRFAAEAFAYLLRKSNDLKSITSHVIKTGFKNRHEYLEDGCALLFFNVFVGVAGHFHSNAEMFFRQLISTLTSIAAEKGELGEFAVAIATQTIIYAEEYAEKSKAKLERFYHKLLVKQLAECSSMREATNLTRLIDVCVSTSRQEKLNTVGKRQKEKEAAKKLKKKKKTVVKEHKSSFEAIDELKTALDKVVQLQDFKLDYHFVEFFSQALLTVFNNDTSRIFTKTITSKIVDRSEDHEELIELLLKTVELDSFDLYIMPSLGRVASAVIEKKDEVLIAQLLRFYAYLCTKRQPLEAVLERGTTRSNFFDLTPHSATKEWIVKTINESLPSLMEKDVQLATNVLLAWPSLFPQSGKLAGVEAVVKLIKTSLKVADNVATSQFLLAAIAGVFSSRPELLKDIKEEDFEEFVRKNNCCESSLIAYEMYITAKGVSDEVGYMNRVSSLLKPAFMSANDNVRKSALHILCCFNVPLEVLEGDDQRKEQPQSLFQVLYAAECTELLNFKERLVHLRKLRYGDHVRHLPIGRSEDMEQIIVYICTSQFFVQFTPLWAGVHEILISFARKMNIDKFWEIMKEYIELVTKEIETPADEVINQWPLSGLSAIDQNNRSDFLTARIQLFNFFGAIVDISERRTKVLVPIVLKQYQLFLSLVEQINESTRKEDLNEEEEEQKDDRKGLRESFRDCSAALVAMLKLFAKFSAPKSAHAEEKLRRMYDHLLSTQYESLQQVALECVLTYKNKIVAQYKDNLEGLLSEQKMRESLTYFKLSEEDAETSLPAEHRAEVVPLVLRILRGRLLVKGDKKGASSRRNGIIFFLGNCNYDEIDFFLKLHLTEFYALFGETSTFEEVAQKCADEGFVKRISTWLLIRVVQDVSEILRRVSRAMGAGQQAELFRVLLITASAVRGLLATSEKKEHLKTMRMTVCQAVSEFLEAYPTRQPSREEIVALRDAIFSAACDGIPANSVVSNESIKLPVAPLAVVKVVATICKQPSMYPLLLLKVGWKTDRNDESHTTMFEMLIAPLLWKGRFELMLKTIRQAVLKLTELADEPLISIDDDLVDKKGLKAVSGLNYGTRIVLTQVSFLLRFLAEEIETEVSHGKKPSLENITLLNKLSPFVNDPEMSERLAVPLFSCVEKRGKCKEETLVEMLGTLSRIAQLVPRPGIFVNRIAPLCSKLTSRVSREALVNMALGFANAKAMGNKNKVILEHFADLEAWDKTKVDEPHFDKRYAAYQALNKIWSGDELVEPALLAIIFHTHMHLVATTTDLSLRMTAANNVRSLVEFAGRTMQADGEKNPRKSFVNGHATPLLVAGFKSDVDAVRQEAISTFTSLVTSFPDHENLAEIGKLANEDDDLDFLSNMNHIQIYKRQHAMTRLVDGINKGTIEISFNTLNKYIVPMVSPYLINTSSKTSALSDEALKVLKTTMSKAPWGRYTSCLEYWMTRVEKRSAESEISDKALVRVLVAVIEAFHFDVNVVEDVPEAPEHDENEDDEPEVNKAKVEKMSILEVVKRRILPKLTGCTNAQTEAVEKNAVTGSTKSLAENFDIQRAPMALATVKFLQKLPEAVRAEHLHGIILKMCHLLMSRSFNVRDAARKTTLQICEILGPKYLPSVIKEIVLTMKKGFQVHVAIFTAHALIIAAKDRLTVGDLDPAIENLVNLCAKDQIEETSDEKDIGAIKAETPEAKGNRSGEVLIHLGRVISAAGIQRVLVPLRESVDRKPTAKIISRVSSLLTKFVSGLKENEGLDTTRLLAYIHQSLSQDIEKMEVVEKEKEGIFEEQEEVRGRRPESCLIIPKAPKRIGALQRTVQRSRVHVFAEFIVQLFAALLHEKKWNLADEQTVAKLNPFLPLMLTCLRFKYDKLIAHSLKAVSIMVKMKLPAVQANTKKLSDRMFVILADYASVGAQGAKPEIQQLNQLLFKTFTSLIETTGGAWLTEEKLSLLLAYAEVDVVDKHKQATMFSMIKNLIKHGVRHERLPQIMDHLAETAIMSPLQNVRAQCRETLVDFIGGASDPEKNPKKHIEFFLDQLEYEYEFGRISTAEMLHLLFRNLLPKTLEAIHMLCVVKLAAALVNDESEKVRAKIATALRQLIYAIGKGAREEISEAVCQWLDTTEENARSVGIQVAVQFSYVEKEEYAQMVGQIAPKMQKILFDEDVYEKNSAESIIAYLHGLSQIVKNVGPSCLPLFPADEYLDSLVPLAKCDEDVAIRREASVLIGQCLWLKSEEKTEPERAQSLANAMCFVLRHEILDEPTAEQASKNILALSAHLNDEAYTHLVQSLSKACHYEIKHQEKKCLKRISCLKLATAMTVTCEKEERKSKILDYFMPLTVRELSGKSANNTEELMKLAQEICELLKEKIGEEEFAARVAKCQHEAAKKILERKRKVKELAVTAPEDAAEMKKRKNKKKSELRKRKLDEAKPYRKMKRANVEKKRRMENEDD